MVTFNACPFENTSCFIYFPRSSGDALPFSLSLFVYSGHFRLSSHRRECQPRVARKTTIIVVYNIVEWPPPMAMLPPIEEEEEEVIRAKRLINSHAFRRLFPSPFVHPFRNLFATSIPLRDIAVCKYHVLHPFFFSFRPCFFQPFLPVSSSTTRMDTSTYSVSSFKSELGRESCAQKERESEKERDNYRVSRKNMQIRVDTRPRNDRDFSSSLSRPFLTRAFPT